MCALIFARFSLAELVCVESSWFALWLLLPALFFVPSVASTPAAEAEVEPGDALADGGGGGVEGAGGGGEGSGVDDAKVE